MSDKLIHPYYNHAYARYDLSIDDVIAGLKDAGYTLDSTGSNGNGGSGSDDIEDTIDPTLRLEVELVVIVRPLVLKTQSGILDMQVALKNAISLKKILNVIVLLYVST